MHQPSILLIGATGRTGLQLIQQAHNSNIPIHAFARTPDKLPQSHARLCKAVHVGNARKVEDITKALEASQANTVILAVGNPNDLAKTDIREASGRALAAAIAKGTAYEHVRAFVLSSIGAGGTTIDLGWGVGAVLSVYLWRVLRDHNAQELALEGLGERVLIARPTHLTDGEGGKKVVEFMGRAPTAFIDRSDVAAWFIRKVAEGCASGQYNITALQ